MLFLGGVCVCVFYIYIYNLCFVYFKCWRTLDFWMFMFKIIMFMCVSVSAVLSWTWRASHPAVALRQLWWTVTVGCLPPPLRAHLTPAAGISATCCSTPARTWLSTSAGCTWTDSAAGSVCVHACFMYYKTFLRLILLAFRVKFLHCSPQVFVCLWKGCKVYNTPSTSQSWLQRHMLSHSGDKPFKVGLFFAHTHRHKQMCIYVYMYFFF